MNHPIIKSLGLSLFLFIAAVTGFAHGSLEKPISRIYQCYLEGPENLKSKACIAAVDVSGKQMLYDWTEINQRNANDRHREIIRDGTLCAGGRDKYAGMNLARNDWVTTTIKPNTQGRFDFVWRATAAHATKYFQLYLTKNGYDITKPLKWSDLEDTPFCTVKNVILLNGRYHLDCPLPKKLGRRILYVIWQRSDSQEAFYSCSDITIA